MPYKGRCDKEVEIFEEHFCEAKNTKSICADGLSDHKPKRKHYDIMSFIDITVIKPFIDITVIKQRYVHIYLTTYSTYIQHTYIQ